MDEQDWDAEAREIRRAAGLDDADAVPGLQIAERHPRVALVQLVHRPIRPFAWRAANDNDMDEITLHDGHMPAAVHLRAATEVVEGAWARRGLPLVDPRIKKGAMATGVRVILPRYGFRKAISAIGREDLAALAAPYLASQTMVAIRMAEIYGHPLALVSAARTWRAVMGWQLPSDTALALIVRRGGTRQWAVQEIDDKPGRWWAVWPRDW
jgi:hypothetical protein